MTRLFFVIAVLSLPVCAKAQSPMPPTHPTRTIEEQQKQTRQQSDALKKQVQKIERELKQTRQDMISLAAKMKANEDKILNLESQIETKQKEKMAIEVRLQKDRGTISDLILGLERINRMPPEALLVRPETPLKTAQSAMLLESILPSLYERAAQLNRDYERLQSLITDLQNKEDKIIYASHDLAEQEKKLQSLLNAREMLLARTQNDYKKKTAEMRVISKQAKSLKELMNKIERRQEQADKIAAARARSMKKQASYTQKVPTPKAGKPQLPASGIILTHYGQLDDIGAKSEGLTIQTRPQGIVVAPMGGVIEYTGSFRNYGNIILMRHTDHYMSLIAGLGQINASVGQRVSAGEPIGKTSAHHVKINGDEKKTTLYYELRHKGIPINPSKKFKGIR